MHGTLCHTTVIKVQHCYSEEWKQRSLSQPTENTRSMQVSNNETEQFSQVVWKSLSVKRQVKNCALTDD